MKTQALAVPALILVLGCASGGPPPAEETEAPVAAAPIPDSEIGLAAGTAFEQPPQAPIAFNTVDPGESELSTRPNADFPPIIPHTTADLETLTLDENSCLECHAVDVAEDMGAVPVPASHLVDLRRSPEKTGDSISEARWVCTSCHVTQTGTDPLVAITSSG